MMVYVNKLPTLQVGRLNILTRLNGLINDNIQTLLAIVCE